MSETSGKASMGRFLKAARPPRMKMARPSQTKSFWCSAKLTIREIMCASPSLAGVGGAGGITGPGRVDRGRIAQDVLQVQVAVGHHDIAVLQTRGHLGEARQRYAQLDLVAHEGVLRRA